jgi:hypothetical protein
VSVEIEGIGCRTNPLALETPRHGSNGSCLEK